MESNTNMPATSTSDNVLREDFLSTIDDDSVQLPANEGVDTSGEPGKTELEIDEKFKSLPQHEAVIRTLQSKYDKLFASNEKTVKEVELNSKSYETFKNIDTDDEWLEAYLAVRKPELVKAQDLSSKINAMMTKEFPDFAERKPTRQQADDNPGSKEWLYFKRLEELYAEFKNSPVKAKDITDLIEKRKAEAQQKQALIDSEITKAQQQLKMSDDEMVGFHNWQSKAGIVDILRLYKIGLRTQRIATLNSNGVAPNISTASPDRQGFLSSLK